MRFIEPMKRIAFLKLRLLVSSTSPSSNGLTRTARVSEYRRDEMCGEPDIFVTHGQVDVEEDQNSREEESEQKIRPIRDGVRGIQIWIEKYEDDQHQSRKEE